MMFGHELIESLHFIAPHRPCVQIDENLLFIGCGLAKGADFFLFHVRQHKKLRPACPAKSFNAFPFSGFPLPKNAPYSNATLLPVNFLFSESAALSYLSLPAKPAVALELCLEKSTKQGSRTG